MKAALYREYGSPNVVHIEELPLPEVESNEVRVRVHATTVSSADSRIRAMRIPTGFKTLSRLIFGITRPKNQVLGSEFSGTIDAVGPDVTQFNVGDSVFGAYEGRGTHAEYFSMAEDEAIEHLPAGFTHEEAAALPFGGLTSLIFLRDFGHIKAGQNVLVIGASGSLGSAAIQFAAHFGAEVTGVCSTKNVELVHSLGASRVIDYTQSNFADEGEHYDLIYETVGKVPFSECKKALKPGGSCLMAVAGIPDYLRMLINPIAGSKKLVTGVAIFKKESLSDLKKLMEEGAIKSVIDSIHTLTDITKAHALVDTGHKRGSVVVRVID
ncbi:MAG: NAD(P)-dependent alcohol dehydrogenase [Rhodothermaceae bacterium]|nr:NAD(P)-dependent alcohol dehydrogenase [Rhodothermaceae bacterium]